MNKFLPPLLIAIALFLVFILVWPQYKILGIKKQEIVSIQKVKEERESILKNIESLRGQLVQRQGDLSRLNNLIPDKPGIPELISSITTIAAQSGISLADISINQLRGSQTAEFGVITADLKLSGNYTGIKTFLVSVEQNSRLFDISKLSIVSAALGGGLNIALQLRGYFVQPGASN